MILDTPSQVGKAHSRTHSLGEISESERNHVYMALLKSLEVLEERSNEDHSPLLREKKAKM